VHGSAGIFGHGPATLYTLGLADWSSAPSGGLAAALFIQLAATPRACGPRAVASLRGQLAATPTCKRVPASGPGAVASLRGLVTTPPAYGLRAVAPFWLWGQKPPRIEDVPGPRRAGREG
jgi:hypothetical protein